MTTKMGGKDKNTTCLHVSNLLPCTFNIQYRKNAELLEF